MVPFSWAYSEAPKRFNKCKNEDCNFTYLYEYCKGCKWFKKSETDGGKEE